MQCRLFYKNTLYFSLQRQHNHHKSEKKNSREGCRYKDQVVKFFSSHMIVIFCFVITVEKTVE